MLQKHVTETYLQYSFYLYTSSSLLTYKITVKHVFCIYSLQIQSQLLLFIQLPVIAHIWP